jgi:hypothetical protein
MSQARSANCARLKRCRRISQRPRDAPHFLALVGEPGVGFPRAVRHPDPAWREQPRSRRRDLVRCRIDEQDGAAIGETRRHRINQGCGGEHESGCTPGRRVHVERDKQAVQFGGVAACVHHHAGQRDLPGDAADRTRDRVAGHHTATRLPDFHRQRGTPRGTFTE